MRWRTAALLVVAACSSKSKSDDRRPVLTAEMRERLKALASPCEDRAGPPQTDLVVTCVPTDEPSRARVDVFLVEKNHVDQLMITLREPAVEAAAGKIAPALAGFVDDKTRDAILATLRATGPDPGYARVADLGTNKDAVVYVKALETTQLEVTLQLMLGPP